MRALAGLGLILGLTEPTLADDWRPPRDLIEGLCLRIAEPEARSALYAGHAVFLDSDLPETQIIDINHDGVGEEIESGRTGSDRSPYLSARDLIEGWAIPDGHAPGADDPERSFGAIAVLHVDRYYFILQSVDRAFRAPSLLYMIGPDNQARMLCRFASQDHQILTYASQNMAPRCHALLETSRTGRLAVEDPAPADHPTLPFAAGPGVPRLTGAVTVDVFNSGDPIRLVQLEYEMGGGAFGCSIRYFDLAADRDRTVADADDLRRTLLLAQGVYPDGDGFASRCRRSDGLRRIFEADGVAYVVNEQVFNWQTSIRMLTSYRTSDVTRRGDDLAARGVFEVCRFAEHPVVSLSETFFDWLDG